MFVLKDRSVDAIEIATARDCRCDSNWIAHLHTLWFRICRHCEIAGGAREALWRVLWQRFYFKRDGFAADLYVTSLAELAKWIRKEWIGEWIIQIEQIEW